MLAGRLVLCYLRNGPRHVSLSAKQSTRPPVFTRRPRPPMPSPDVPSPGDDIDADQLRALARRAVDDGPDSRSAAADRIGVHRSTVTRALNDPDAPLDDVRRQLVREYLGLDVGEGRKVYTVLGAG